MRGGDPPLLLRWQNPKAGFVLALLGRERGCRCWARATAPHGPVLLMCVLRWRNRQLACGMLVTGSVVSGSLVTGGLVTGSLTVLAHGGTVPHRPQRCHVRAPACLPAPGLLEGSGVCKLLLWLDFFLLLLWKL